MRCTAHRWKVKSPPGRLINARPCDATQVMSDDDMYAILPSGITAVSPSLGATPPSQFVPSLQAEVSPPPFQVISPAASAAAAPKKVIGRRRQIIKGRSGKLYPFKSQETKKKQVSPQPIQSITVSDIIDNHLNNAKKIELNGKEYQEFDYNGFKYIFDEDEYKLFRVKKKNDKYYYNNLVPVNVIDENTMKITMNDICYMIYECINKIKGN